jgi:hypothetical protein
VTPRPRRPGFVSGRLTKRHVVCLIFCRPSYNAAKASSENPELARQYHISDSAAARSAHTPLSQLFSKRLLK